jgi:uncharacterized membrane protein YeaQ/YmgE (transglycosylase-associated protein family)
MFGALSGWVTSLIIWPDESQSGNETDLMDILLGIVGALVGGMLAVFISGASTAGFNFISLFMAVIGALAVLVGVRSINKI